MNDREIDKKLSQLELSISPDLREQAESLMHKPCQNLKASQETLSEVMAEIKAAEKAAAEIEARLYFFPKLTKVMQNELDKREVRLQSLRAELDILKDNKTIGKRRLEYSIFSYRIDIAEKVAKTHMQVVGLGNRAIIKDRLKVLKLLRKFVNKEYSDVKFVRVVSEKPAIKSESAKAKATQRKILMAYELPGVQSIPFFDMSKDVRTIFEEGRSNIVLRHTKKLMYLVPGQEFPVELYMFNRHPYWDFNPTVRIDSDYIDLITPAPRTFRFPRGECCVRYSTTARASDASNGEWIDSTKESKEKGKYELASGFFLPGKISAYVRIDPNFPESKSHLYLPIVKKAVP